MAAKNRAKKKQLRRKTQSNGEANGLTALPGWRRDPAHAIRLEEAVAASPTQYGWIKPVVDFVLALVLLVAVSPLLAFAAALVRLTSRGPAFYAQVRLGKSGRPFVLYKIRTMPVDCEGITGPLWAKPRDPRCTRIGGFFRRTHLDELPQLWNVLRGEMSLVGPRPERPEFVAELERAIPCYRDRMLVRPGLTGLAQVQLPADTDLGSVRRKLAYDLYYIRHGGFWLDLRLLVCTGVHLIGVPFHVLSRWFRMPHKDRIEDAYRGWHKEAAPLLDLHSA